MSKREPPLRIPLDFDETLRGLLQTPPPPETQAALDELDVEGIFAFAEEVLPSAAHLWTHASLNQRNGSSRCFSRRGSATREAD